MKFKVGDKFKIWFVDNAAYIHIASYRNDGRWTLQELKDTLFMQMYPKDFVVEDVGIFKVKMNFWGEFRTEHKWISKLQIRSWRKNNSSKESLWKYICKEVLHVKPI